MAHIPGIRAPRIRRSELRIRSHHERIRRRAPSSRLRAAPPECSFVLASRAYQPGCGRGGLPRGRCRRGHSGAPAHCQRSANEFSGMARINRRRTEPHRAPLAQEVNRRPPAFPAGKRPKPPPAYHSNSGNPSASPDPPSKRTYGIRWR